ncbi:MAG: dihydrolipoyl dehydrogenase [Firmicutes bacterium]|nr:dihydrolipoyl dehydrogenase [Bacillota bacterium]
MTEQTVDVVVLGGGTGGYVAAIRGAQLGLKVAVVESGKLGGTCLHQGCIPSKALLRSAQVFAQTKEAQSYGVLASDVRLDLAQAMRRKDDIVGQLHKGVEFLMKKHKIEVIEGYGRVMGPSIFSPTAGAVRVQRPDGESEILSPRYTIIATGSRPRSLPGLPFDGQRILSSDDALALAKLPSSMLIIGGGAIGIEWASMLHDFGVDVTVVEALPRLLAQEDEEVSAEMARLLKKRKIRVLTNAAVDVESYRVQDEVCHISVRSGEKVEGLSAEQILVAVGREARVQDIGLEATAVIVDRGVIAVDRQMRTAEKAIYAIGDVVGGLQLAHVAAHEGILAMEAIAGHDARPIDYAQVARCTYSQPEVASVGITEAQAKQRGLTVKTGKFAFRAIGKALVQGETDGFVKIVCDEATNDLLGVHMIGPHATDLISEAGLALLLNASPWEIGQMIHPHPTLSEALGEAALAVDGLAIHA